MSEHDAAVYLHHILDAIAKIEEYVDGLSEEDFLTDSLTQDGVIRQLEIIGEATKHISPDLQQKHPEIPWSDMARMRDRLIHGYFGVDINLVWLTAVRDIPALKEQLSKLRLPHLSHLKK